MINGRSFRDLFGSGKPVIGCIHLLPLPGSPLYEGSMEDIYKKALEETDILVEHGIHGLIVENFRDKPFFPGDLPRETIASLSAVGREIVRRVHVPVGINALRSDGESAVAIATAIGAHLIRVNVHMNAVVSEQGIIQGASHRTLRLRSNLRSGVLIFADVGVKHAAPLADRGLAVETRDLTERGLADGIIVSGEMTGVETKASDVEVVRQHTHLPLLIGSGVTPENIHQVYDKADGFIVGSYFKKDGKGENFIERERVKRFMEKIRQLERK
ncbi:MAG: BtpA/SgcQ family protein [Deltaproteobacteria bacterium]|nr:MAG: BtpA/SgcQ family protein [Deltaproteobacteria bacterium]